MSINSKIYFRSLLLALVVAIGEFTVRYIVIDFILFLNYVAEELADNIRNAVVRLVRWWGESSEIVNWNPPYLN